MIQIHSSSPFSTNSVFLPGSTRVRIFREICCSGHPKKIFDKWSTFGKSYRKPDIFSFPLTSTFEFQDNIFTSTFNHFRHNDDDYLLWKRLKTRNTKHLT
ncbi:hypothetical protein PYW08_001011 [Mythimna loreyi]|uniref:Uncharacterized protein n=1 Tax=Mythimna loreyi TaxID=667449 RepID=A0ACC2R062_9NEOP|nr:hypothetical protein PYW08_001011 [Mythimna loreyi]